MTGTSATAGRELSASTRYAHTLYKIMLACSELYEPANRMRAQVASLPIVHGLPMPHAEMSAQQRKDSWRGRSASANLAQGQMLPDVEGSLPQKDSWRGKGAPQPPGVLNHAHHLQTYHASQNSDYLFRTSSCLSRQCTSPVGATARRHICDCPSCLGFEGPIRSRLVENGYLGEVEPAKGMRQGAGAKAWPQQDEAEANPHPGPPTNSHSAMVGDFKARDPFGFDNTEMPRVLVVQGAHRNRPT